MESTVKYFTDNNIIRASYKHLYLINGKFEFLTTDKNIKIDPIISHSNSTVFTLLPITKVFENNTLLKIPMSKTTLSVVIFFWRAYRHYMI
tara:strand:+ start:1252 stop:1524 length:273 start_codon:yes stop_codon:yes gene_type:complete